MIDQEKMDLSNLKPAKGSTKGKKRIGRGQGSGYGGTLHVVIKDRNPDPVIPGHSDLKVDKCPCSDVCQNLGLQTSTERSLKQLILLPSGIG